MKLVTNKLVRAHKILANNKRLALFWFINKHDGVNSAQLLKHFKMSPSTLTFHTQKLEMIKAIYTTKKDNFLEYHANKAFIKQVRGEMQHSIDDATTKFITCNKMISFKAKDLAKIYNLFSDKSRFQIWQLIANNPGITGKELHILTKQSEALISFHNKKLVNAKCVSCKKFSNQIYYWIDLGFVISFYNYLTNN